MKPGTHTDPNSMTPNMRLGNLSNIPSRIKSDNACIGPEDMAMYDIDLKFSSPP